MFKWEICNDKNEQHENNRIKSPCKTAQFKDYFNMRKLQQDNLSLQRSTHDIQVSPPITNRSRKSLPVKM